MNSARYVFDTNTLVSDKDLLSLHPFGDVAVITPVEFLAAIKKDDKE
jgi:predicted nucleic acid-binding protein